MVLRILQVLPSLEMGGVERGTIDTAIIIQKNNMIPFVASSGGKMVSQLEEKYIKHFCFWTHSKNPFVIIVNSFIIFFIIYFYKIDIVHARSRAPAWSCWLACKFSNAKFITTFHNRPNGTDFFFKKWYNQIMTWGVKVIAPSAFVKNHIIAYYKRKPEDVVCIYRGIDTKLFSNIEDYRIQKLKKKYNITNEKIICLPGRLTYWKGQMHFLESIRLLFSKKNDIVCLLIGDGSKKFKQQLLHYIDLYQLPVIIDPHCEDIYATYALSDIIVNASIKEETFGRVAVEGQAAGKTVIATCIGGSLETIVNNKSGYLIYPDDPISLSDKILECLTKNNLDKNNILDQSKKFDINIFEKNIIKLYSSL